MTHAEIMKRIRLNPTVGDYISIAVADGWPKERVIRNLYDHILTYTGETLWADIEALYIRYMETHALGAPEQKERIVRSVSYKGVVYKTIREAGRKNGVSDTTVRNAIKKGIAKYV